MFWTVKYSPKYAPVMVIRNPPTARGRQTRDRVLSAAIELIRQRGVAAVTLDDVERTARVGRSQLYHYFDGRDDLIRAVVNATVDMVLGGSADLLASLDTAAGIERWFARTERLCAEQGGAGGCPIGSLVGQLAEQDELARLALVDAFDRWEGPLREGLGRMRDRGDLRPDLDVAELADSIMASLQGGLLLAQVRRDPRQLHRALNGARTAIAAASPGTGPDAVERA